MKGLVFREFQNQPIIQGRESHPILYLTPSPNKNTKTKLFGSKFVFFFYLSDYRGCAVFRDAQITNLLLRQSWLQIVKGEELSDAVEGVGRREGLNCNGFNSFC